MEKNRTVKYGEKKKARREHNKLYFAVSHSPL